MLDFFARKSLSVAQWIVHMPPKRGIQVRFLSEGPSECLSSTNLSKIVNEPVHLYQRAGFLLPENVGEFFLDCKTFTKK